MKIYFILLLFTSTLLCQNLKALDQKNGFRNIKLGSYSSQYSFLEKITSENREYKIVKKILDSVFIDYYGTYNSSSDCLSHNCEDFIVSEKSDIYSNLAGSKIKKIGVKTYKNKIYEINIILEARAGGFYTFSEFVRAFGYPNSINYNWDISEFDKAEKNDDPLYMSWYTNKVRMSIISFNANEKFQGTKRIGYSIRYTDIKTKKFIDEENKNKQTKNNPADQF